jgi:tripartite-type tricarboxylate transporter receptor subunit TctC
MGDQIQLASVALPAAISLVKANKVKALAVTSARRVSSLPEVPTVAELGYPGFSFATWVGVFAPAKTPQDIVRRLNSELNLTLFIPEFQQQLDQAGFSPIGGSLDKSSDYLKSELLKYAKVVKETGITAD